MWDPGLKCCLEIASGVRRVLLLMTGQSGCGCYHTLEGAGTSGPGQFL